MDSFTGFSNQRRAVRADFHCPEGDAVSKNFELMQALERNRTFSSNRVIEPAFPVSSDDCKHQFPPRVSEDLTQGLVQRIFLQQTHEPPRVVVFAAVDHGNGCSQVAVSVAETLAGSAPGGACLVEANFRSPALPGMLGTTNYLGLTDALVEQGSIRSFAKPMNGNLWLISSGAVTADSVNLLTAERIRPRFAELRQEFDFIIVDAPPVSRYADAIALGKLSDGIVLVLEAESTRREAARIVVETLRSSRIPVLGAVLNKRTFPIPERIYKKL
jgi:Mrp family chromosome partitioning ATPase